MPSKVTFRLAPRSLRDPLYDKNNTDSVLVPLNNDEKTLKIYNDLPNDIKSCVGSSEPMDYNEGLDKNLIDAMENLYFDDMSDNEEIASNGSVCDSRIAKKNFNECLSDSRVSSKYTMRSEALKTLDDKFEGVLKEFLKGELAVLNEQPFEDDSSLNYDINNLNTQKNLSFIELNDPETIDDLLKDKSNNQFDYKREQRVKEKYYDEETNKQINNLTLKLYEKQCLNDSDVDHSNIDECDGDIDECDDIYGDYNDYEFSSVKDLDCQSYHSQMSRLTNKSGKPILLNVINKQLKHKEITQNNNKKPIILMKNKIIKSTQIDKFEFNPVQLEELDKTSKKRIIKQNKQSRRQDKKANKLTYSKINQLVVKQKIHEKHSIGIKL